MEILTAVSIAICVSLFLQYNFTFLCKFYIQLYIILLYHYFPALIVFPCSYSLFYHFIFVYNFRHQSKEVGGKGEGARMFFYVEKLPTFVIEPGDTV